MALVSKIGKHFNPWNGVCIHGKKGAYLYKGGQVNPGCALCVKAGRDGRG